MYYEKPYYLAAAKGGDKVYSLLRQILEATDKVAVATFVMQKRQHLCAISPPREVTDVAHARFCRRGRDCGTAGSPPTRTKCFSAIRPMGLSPGKSRLFSPKHLCAEKRSGWKTHNSDGHLKRHARPRMTVARVVAALLSRPQMSADSGIALSAAEL